MEKVMSYMITCFPMANIQEQHFNMLQYQLPSNNLALSQVFRVMEEAKALCGVEDYSVSQTTLDQVSGAVYSQRYE